MRIAIIGSGISGLGAAYELYSHHAITVYEANTTPGGHSRTITIKTPTSTLDVDTGFIVFNHKNYPRLTHLFKTLDVPTAPSSMSLALILTVVKSFMGQKRYRDYLQLPNSYYRGSTGACSLISFDLTE